MQDVCIIITTFLRNEFFFRCVKSIRKYYPDIAIFSVDTGKQKEEDSILNIEYKYTQYRVQFDAGVCVAKNEGLRRIPEKYKYIVILEDDIIFTENTRLDIWHDILERRKHIGIIGGAFTKDIRGHRVPQQYEATLDIKGDAIHLEKMEHPPLSKWERLNNIRFFYCDIVINCFMMRRAVWNDVKWDERFKTSPEHTDFFLSVKKKTGWKVAFTDQVNIDHVPDYSNVDYMKYRSRSFGYKALADKWKVKYYYNSWHPQWGIKNPMDLELYSILRKSPIENVKNTGCEAVKLTTKVEFKDRMKVAIGIKTFLREETLFKTLDSIEYNFPYPYKIYIADDSPASYRKEHRYSELERKGHQIIRSSYNSGISVGRNAIIDHAKEDYILIMDDDFLIEDPASIINMKRVLDHHEEIGVCAGMLFLENGQHWGTERYNRGLTLEIKDNILYRHSTDREVEEFYGVKFLYADQVVNFFLARREMFKDIQWDNAIKIEYEHMDFFIRLKETKWKVATCLDAKAIHQSTIPNDYTYNQCRRNAPTEYFYKKHGITGIENQFLRGR